MKLKTLRASVSTRRLAVTNRHPRFSWEMESEEKNVFQSAYEITVKDHTGALVWDSGKVQSRETSISHTLARRLYPPADMSIRSQSGTATGIKR